MQINITMIYHCTSTGMAVIKTGIVNGEDSETEKHLYFAGGNVEWCSQCGNQFGCFLKIKNRILYDLEIPLLGIF